MDASCVIDGLYHIGELCSEGRQSLDYLQRSIDFSNEIIADLQKNDISEEICYSDFYAQFTDYLELQEKRFICAINTLYLLHVIQVTYEKGKDGIQCDPADRRHKMDIQCDPGDRRHTMDIVCIQESVMKSVQDSRKSFFQWYQNEQKSIVIIHSQEAGAVEKSVRFIMYTSVLACLDPVSSLFMRMKVVKEKLLFGADLIQLPHVPHFNLLKLNMKFLLPVFKDERLGERLRSNLMGEFLVPVILLSFSPQLKHDSPDDVNVFRSELDYMFNHCNESNILQFILVQRTLLHQTKGGNWQKTVYDSLYVHRFLLKEEGVAKVIRAALAFCDVEDWRKKEAVAALISSTKCSNENSFYECTGKQILSLLRDENKTELMSILSSVIIQLCQRSRSLASQYLLNPIIEPLILLTNDHLQLPLQDADVSETVDILYNIYVEASTPSHELNSLLEPILCPLLAMASLPETCRVKTKAFRILIRYLSQLKSSEISRALVTLSGLEIDGSILPVNPQIILTPDLNHLNRINVQLVSTNFEGETLSRDEDKAKCIISILEKLKVPSATKEFCLKLVQYFDFGALNRLRVPENTLLTVADEAEIQFAKVRPVSMATNLLSLAFDQERLTEDLLGDLPDAVSFMKNLLLVGKQPCEDPGLLQTRESMLMNCIMMISFFVSDRIMLKKMTYTDWIGLQSLLPELDALKCSNCNPALLEFIDLLIATINTHGITQLPKRNTEDSEGYPPVDSSSRYNEAMNDICSPLLPVRGHAILTLTRLLQEKDGDAISNSLKLLSLFEHHLRDEDSYIYLLSVEGLVSLADAFPDKVVAALTGEVNKGVHTVETRLKLLEVLTRISRGLGPMLPKFRDLFINPLLHGGRDSDPYIRAACLSNLGEVCKELRFSVGPIMQEVFSLIYEVIKFDKMDLVRRSAVQFLSLLLRGLRREAIQILKDTLLELYRELKFLVSYDNDLVLVLHAQLALQEIDSVTKEFLTPSNRIQKKLYITEIPPSI